MASLHCVFQLVVTPLKRLRLLIQRVNCYLGAMLVNLVRLRIPLFLILSRSKTSTIDDGHTSSSSEISLLLDICLPQKLPRGMGPSSTELLRILTESTMCMTTWKATKAAKMNTLQDGSSAFCRYTAKKIVTTETDNVPLSVNYSAINCLYR